LQFSSWEKINPGANKNKTVKKYLADLVNCNII